MSFVLVTTPLVLHADPVLPAHAVTRQYVDNKRTNVNASWFTTGVIAPARMPALGGDVSSVAGSGTLSLNVNGVVAGTYAKVTVDATGRVTAGGVLGAADIASVSWNKITSGKPTTAAGYGITNLIALSGGSSSGNISSSAVPSAALHAVTKGYVDNAISGAVSASLSTGDVIRKPVTVAPSGFLRCNGGNVSKTTYAALYAIVGDNYSLFNVAGQQLGAGQPWCQQYYLNKAQSQDFTGWSVSNPLSTAMVDHQVVVTKNRVYIVAGGGTASVYTAEILTDGSIGNWTSGPSLPGGKETPQVFVVRSRVYVIGGFLSGNWSTAIYYSTINADGTLGAWVTDSNTLNTINSKQIVTSSKVYCFGWFKGFSGTGQVSVATILEDGSLSSWVNHNGSPSVAAGNYEIAVTKSRVYFLGGQSGYGGLSSVYTAPINADGTLGAWASGTPLPGLRHSFKVVVTDSKVYLLGGRVGEDGSSTNVCYTAPINADGTLGTWSTSTSLPATIYSSQAIVTSSGVYLLGGVINGANSSTVYKATCVGGLNDYMQIYNKEYIVPSLTDFTLPDFSTLEENNINYFIKF